ncbi:fibrocystin-L [Protopterus annectens]|uniref:fibrocystin-L n=1 Tax=Protopterus annectens TaxID=7888 RepID=UPI001CFB4A2A|nr:fibrocystin-L [Protopterus annectens]
MGATIKPRATFQHLGIHFLLTATLLGVTGGQISPRIDSVFPSYGSLNGATKLTILGQGFSDANQFDFGAGTEYLGNSVQLVSGSRSIPCDVEKDSSHSDIIICYTRPMPEDTYTVRVSVDSVPIPSSSTCNGYLSSCSFYPRSYYTPTINSVTPLSGPPGTLLTMKGRIVTDVYGSNTALSSTGLNVRVLRAYAGGMPCQLLIPDSDTLYGLTQDTMICKMTGTYVGHYNISYILDSNYGRSMPNIATYFVSSLNKIYMFQTYADITGVTPLVGSIHGGTILTITGDLFDQTDAPATVLIGGQNCAVLNLTNNEIICETAAKPKDLPLLFPGSRGIKVEMWKNQNPSSLDAVLLYNSSTSGYQEATWVDAASYSWPNSLNYFVARLSGFFVPPETDNYTFFIRGDDRSALYFSETGHPRDKVKIAYCDWASNSYYNIYTQQSKVFLLQKGKPYYLEILLQQYTFTAFVDVAVFKYITPYSSQQISTVVQEIQALQSQMSLLPEIQVITLENWTTGPAVKEVQQITVTCLDGADCILYSYKLSYQDEQTDFLTANATAVEVESALNVLLFIKPDTVSVTREEFKDGYVYNVTFNSERGGFDILQAEIDGENFTVAIEKLTEQPYMKTFTLSWDGVDSLPIPSYANATQVKAALVDMLSAKCPEEFVNQNQASGVIYFQDYESPVTWGSSSYRGEFETDAFCGRYSLKNPYILFSSTDIPREILLSTYSQFCYAYKGYPWITFYITVQYQDINFILYTTTVAYSKQFPEGNDIRWIIWNSKSLPCQHICFINITEVLYATFMDFLKLLHQPPAGRHLDLQNSQHTQRPTRRLKLLHFLAFIICTCVCLYILGINLRRPGALANRGIFIRQLDVQQRTTAANSSLPNQYEITMSTYNCGCNIPLLAVEFTQVFSNSTQNEAVYRNNNWPKETQIRVQRTQAASPPIGGTFDISAYGNTIDGLESDISATDLQYALQSIPDIGQVSVSRSGSCSGYYWTINWVSKGGNQPLLQVNDSKITGVNAKLTASVVREGGILYSPIMGDMLRTPNPAPQVEVFINRLPSICSGNCTYKWDPSATPVISSINPTTGSYADGTVLTISGSGFIINSVNETISVIVGSTDCPVISATVNQITCQVGNSSAGPGTVTINIPHLGWSERTAIATFNFTYQMNITGMSPLSGSLTGGTLLTITGYGFSQSSEVLVGNKSCAIIQVNMNEIDCITPEASSGFTDVVVLTNGLNATAPSHFSYDDALTPTITMIAPNASTVIGNTSLIISGLHFQTFAAGSTVYIGNNECQIQFWNSTYIMCLLPKLPPRVYSIKVRVGMWGYAAVSSSLSASIEYILEVTDVHPAQGSLYGGTSITLSGSGFVPGDVNTAVFLGSMPCDITSVLEDEVTCITRQNNNNYLVTNNGKHPTYGTGYAWSPSSLNVLVGDTVVWVWQAPQFVTGVGYRVFSVSNPGDVDYNGNGFNSGSKTDSGTFSYQFTSPGAYYYSSGYVDNSNNILMQGVVLVAPVQDSMLKLNVLVDGIEANYIQGIQRNQRSIDNCLAAVPDCSQTPSTTFNESGLFFQISSCYSPTITNISLSSGTVHDEITISGTGFSNTTCANEVTIGGYPCIVNQSTDVSITCKVDPQDMMKIGIAELVSVTVHNLGAAVNTLTNEFARRFVLLPSIDYIDPAVGSTTGMTSVNIYGSGFVGNISDISINIAGILCSVVSVNYTHIQCKTMVSTSERRDPVMVLVQNIPAKCLGSCNFWYSNSIIPSVETVFPSTLSSLSTEVHITGTGFGNDSYNVIIAVGDWIFYPSDITDNNITCMVGPVPAGTYHLRVVVKNKGLALGAQTITSLAVASLQPSSGSINGGTTLLITGNGFLQGFTYVTIGTTPCLLTSVTPGEIHCITPAGPEGPKDVVISVNTVSYPVLTFTRLPAMTPNVTHVTPTSGPPGTEIAINGSGFGTNISEILVTIGGVPCNVTMVSDNLVNCVVGNHAGGLFGVAIFHTVKGYATSTANFMYELRIETVAPNEGSFGGGAVLTVTGAGFDPQLTAVSVCNASCVVDMLSSTSEVLYCEVPFNNGTNNIQVCSVTATNGNNTVQHTDAFTYKSTLTPIITDVHPRRGGTAGGTSLTVTGSGFSTQIEEVMVTIAGTPCNVTFTNSTNVICITNSHSPSEQTKVKVNIGHKGIAKLDNADFFYIDVWSSIYTWGGLPPPDEGSFAVITEGQTILLDQSTPVLKMLLIQGGKLVFDEADIELQAENILIANGGILQIGTEAAPFQHKAIITLHGHLRSVELPIYGAKTLAVREGVLDLHGMPVPVVWTRLAVTALKGSSTLVLMQSVTWKAGDEIAIASTGNRLSQSQNEKRTIANVSADGKTLSLTEPLNYTHTAVSVPLPDGTVFEGRAEVGLLTRNILIRGSTNVEWSDTISACPEGFDPGEFAVQTCFQGRFGEEIGSDQFGGCIMFHAPTPNQNLAIGRIEYVEIFHAGQAFRLGRYPIHWHLMGDVNFKSYVKGCAIHQTYNRAVTIHNTHHLLVENNIIYDIMGGAFFIEDGIEHGNILQYNLAIFVKQSTSLLNDDITPAGFWVTNPNNTIRHNAVAGGTHFGFWYRMHNNPDGPSYDPNICQKRVPLGEFYNNTVHSQGWFGIWIFEEYYPMRKGSCYSSDPEPAKFKSLTTWNSQKGAEWVNGGALQFHNFVVVNNELAGIEMKRVVPEYVGGWGDTKGAVIYNAVVVGHIDELALGSNFCTNKGIVLPFNEGLTVSNVTFINFDRPSCAAVGVTSITGTCSDRCGGWSAKFSGVRYFNTANKAGFRWEHEVVLIDTDGSLSGNVGNKVIPTSQLLDTDHCKQDANWSVGFPGSVCDNTTSFHRLAFNNPSPSSLFGKNVILTNSHGSSVVPYLPKRLTHKPGWMALIPNADTFNWYFQNAAYMANISYFATFYGFKVNDYVIISHNLTQKPDKFQIIDARNGSNQSLSWDNNYNGDWYFNDNTTTVYYLVSGKVNSKRRRREARSLDPTMRDVNVYYHTYACFYENCNPPLPPTFPPLSSSNKTNRSDTAFWEVKNSSDTSFWEVRNWSDTSFWESSALNNYTVPRAGSTVNIPPGVWLLADVVIPPLNKLIIYGALELLSIISTGRADRSFSPYQTVVLNATYISIQGGRLIAGTEDSPFRGELQIILRGNHFTPEWPLPNGPNQGSKVLGVFGDLDLHGLPHTVYKTKLRSTAVAGSTSISLVNPVDWKVGDDILITTTSYSSWQSEVRTIANISEDGLHLVLNESLSYTHIAETYQVPETGQNYTLAADVGLLTRNIKIIGEDYPQLIEESFGARVLVSTFQYNGAQLRAAFREFFLGKITNAGSMNGKKETSQNGSYVQGCSFHHGFSPAIGVFDTNGLDIDDNIIYFTVGEGIIISGSGNRARGNLVVLAVWPGTYNGRLEKNNPLWHAAIEVRDAENVVLQNNVVAGFERAGYQIDGEPCPGQYNPVEDWYNNEAHSGLYGIYMNQDGLPTCSHIQGFTLWKCWDYGIYFQVMSSVKISNVTLADNGMGIFSIVYTPTSLSHETSNKTIAIKNALLVGSSPDFNCSDIVTNSDNNIALSNQHRSTRPPKGGRSGICWPTFASGHNLAPGHPNAGLMTYPAISGLMTVQNSVFVGYRNICSSETNVMFMTNPANDDLQHPIHVDTLQVINSAEKAKVFIHRPDLSKVNPSDCVDMECDGKKKNIIKDLDGSFLGKVGTVIPQAEYQWDGDKRYGIGDYRIPKLLLTRLNGSRIPVAEIAPYKGILRDSSCTYISEWEAYKCFSLNYDMLVIESLDSDTETRRLSPVALLAGGYIDLLNGPQDHGWCNGYTCQKRVSLFHGIVAMNQSYQLFFTSTTPQNLRLMLLNAKDDEVRKTMLFAYVLQ